MNRIAIAALSLAALTACTPESAPEDYAELLPDGRLLVSMPAEIGGTRGGNPAEFYGFTAKVTRDVNDLIGTVILTLDLGADRDAVAAELEAAIEGSDGLSATVTDTDDVDLGPVVQLVLILWHNQ